MALTKYHFSSSSDHPRGCFTFSTCLFPFLCFTVSHLFPFFFIFFLVPVSVVVLLALFPWPATRLPPPPLAVAASHWAEGSNDSCQSLSVHSRCSAPVFFFLHSLFSKCITLLPLLALARAAVATTFAVSGSIDEGTGSQCEGKRAQSERKREKAN